MTDTVLYAVWSEGENRNHLESWAKAMTECEPGSHIIFCDPGEDRIAPHHSIPEISDQRFLADKLFAIKQSRNLTVEFITGNAQPEPDIFCINPGDGVSIRKLFDKVTMWPFYLWQAHAFMNFINIKVPPKRSKFLVCKNNRGHNHRLIMVDQLYRNQLHQDNIITWNVTLDTYQYECQYWQPHTRQYPEYRLSDKRVYVPQSTDRGSDYMQSEVVGYDDTAVELVCEGSDELMFFTEKTYNAILTKKVFLIHGCRYINQTLTRYGFRLFDNIFDYGFDQFHDTLDRAANISDQLSDLSHTPPQEIYEQCKPILDHNYDVLLEILSSDEYYPMHVVEQYPEYKQIYNHNKKVAGKKC